MTPRLPHHRANLRVVRDYPRIDERRDDPAEREAIRIGIVVGFLLGLMVVIAALAYVTGAG